MNFGDLTALKSKTTTKNSNVSPSPERYHVTKQMTSFSGDHLSKISRLFTPITSLDLICIYSSTTALIQWKELYTSSPFSGILRKVQNGLRSKKSHCKFFTHYFASYLLIFFINPFTLLFVIHFLNSRNTRQNIQRNRKACTENRNYICHDRTKTLMMIKKRDCSLLRNHLSYMHFFLSDYLH